MYNFFERNENLKQNIVFIAIPFALLFKYNTKVGTYFISFKFLITNTIITTLL